MQGVAAGYRAEAGEGLSCIFNRIPLATGLRPDCGVKEGSKESTGVGTASCRIEAVMALAREEGKEAVRSRQIWKHSQQATGFADQMWNGRQGGESRLIQGLGLNFWGRAALVN